MLIYFRPLEEEKKSDDNWIRVRHVPAGNAWHPATDQLNGNEVYGDPSNDCFPWSIKFDHM